MAVATTLALGSLGISAVSSALGFGSSKSEAKARRKAAERAAAIAKERSEREERLERERIEYEVGVSERHAEWEIEKSLEAAEFTAERIQEEATFVMAAQKAGYAASGVGLKGSSLAVVTRTAKTAQIERERVFRGHEIFEEARTLEVEELRAGEEAAFGWFTERLHAETKYGAESRAAEIKMYESQEKYARYGQFLSVGSSLLSGATDLFSAGGPQTTSSRGSAAPYGGRTTTYGSQLTTPFM